MKIFIILILFSCSTIYSYSQSYIGIKGAFNMSSMTSGSGVAKGGYSFGAFYDTPITESLSFFPSLQFVFNNSQARDKHQPDYYLQSYSVEAPLLLSLRLNDEMFKLAFDFGPYFRYGVAGESWIYQEVSEKVSYNTFDQNKRFDWGSQVGVGVIMNSNIYINFNVQYGFIKPSENIRGNNLTYNIGFGYAFEL